MNKSKETLSKVPSEVSIEGRSASQDIPPDSDGAASAGGYQPDFGIFKLPDKRVANHRKAEKKLERTAWGHKVLQLARALFKSFWDAELKEAEGRELAKEARWLLKRRGHYNAWFGKHGGVPVELDGGLEDIKSILASLRHPGRPPKNPFDDMVAACALVYRTEYRGLRVPSYAPLAEFLELPEFGYPLTPPRVGQIANEVCRSFARVDGPRRYPVAFKVCGAVGDTLIQQITQRANPNQAPAGKAPRKV